ncbi:MAG: TIGR04282 family arsenosugar biosynthesis glycosyltransferase [Halioglobus sp.]
MFAAFLHSGYGSDTMVADHAGHKGELLLIQFAKSPVPGQVKTRMLPVLNAEQACALHQELLEWTCHSLCNAGLGEVELWVSGNSEHQTFKRCLNQGVSCIALQCGEDLGARMCHALADGLARYQCVILVGSDCPAISPHYLSGAVRALASNSVVLGPADDGGYVLVGMTQLCCEMFEGIEWGQNTVWADTVKILEGLSINWEGLASLPDIDRPEDLSIWHAIQRLPKERALKPV